MKEYSFFHKDTGVLAPHVLGCPDDALEINTPADHTAIEGAHDHLSKRVDVATGEVVDYQPPAPSVDHEWNDASKRWQLSAAAQAKIDKRAAALARITQLEASQHRPLREMMLDPIGGVARVREIDAEIAALRKDL